VWVGLVRRFRLFGKRRRRFVVFLTGRGRRLRLGEVEAGDPEEFKRGVMLLLSLNGSLARVFPRIWVVDLDRGDVKRFRNPFFRGGFWGRANEAVKRLFE